MSKNSVRRIGATLSIFLIGGVPSIALAVQSDEFNGSTLNAFWTYGETYAVDDYYFTGTQIVLDMGPNEDRDIWTDIDHAPRIMQATSPAEDFTVEVKIDSPADLTFQGGGILIQESPGKYLRFDFFSNQGSIYIFIARVELGDGSQYYISKALGTVEPSSDDYFYFPIGLKLEKQGNTYRAWYSENGGAWEVAEALAGGDTFTEDIQVNMIGVHAVTASENDVPPRPNTAPAYACQIDYFRYVTTGDQCPDDPNKTDPGICGCGVPDVDSDSDTVADCIDNCPNTPNTDQADGNNNGIGDACESTGQGPYSDEFDGASLNTGIWTFVDPLTDCSQAISGGILSITVPVGAGHNIWTDGNNAPRIVQPCPDVDLDLEAKFDSLPATTYQMQGMIAEQDADNYLRIEFLGSGGSVFLYVASFEDNSPTTQVFTQVALPAPLYLRVVRTADQWSIQYSGDGQSWQEGVNFEAILQVATVGVYAGSVGDGVDNAPGFVGQIDYFKNNDDSGPTDLCPDDPDKTAPGICGCGVPDTDTDSDTVADCIDNCPNTPNTDQADGDNNGIGDACEISGDGPFSDYFDSAPLNTAIWNFVNPVGDGSADVSGGALALSLPDGSNHDIWTSGNDSARVMQSCPDDDLSLEIKFNSVPSARFQMQGMIIEQNANNYLRIEFLNVGSLNLYVAAFVDGSPITKAFTGISLSAPMYLRVQRSGDQFTVLYSQDGNAFTEGVVFEQQMQVSAVGVFAGNVGDEPGNAPAFTALVDQFVNLNNPGNPPVDLCPDDPNKIVPGVCGCGVPDDDTDNDGTEDCNDNCPDDPNKTEPGDCGCGVADEDLNNNGTSDCLESDQCPNDPDKTQPGVCGCGVPDDDSDNDGVEDCIDNCPNTPNADQTDGDNNGIGDACQSAEPGLGPYSDYFAGSGLNVNLWTFIDPRNDASATVNGGLLTLSIPQGTDHNLWTDGNYAPRVMQDCPDTDLELEVKFAAPSAERFNMCGMILEQDADNYIRAEFLGTGTFNIFVAAFVGGNPQTKAFNQIPQSAPMYLRVVRVGDLWTILYSSNGSTWTEATSFESVLQISAVGVFTGNMGDSGPAPAVDCQVDYFINLNNPDNAPEDFCPDDPNKTVPGVCGCGVPDDDSDSDGTPDCEDGCPDDPDKIEPGDCGCGQPDVDTDNDGTADCIDGCPGDPAKSDPGICGCGVADSDTDSDGWLNCEDNCPVTPNPDQIDSDNNGIGDACEDNGLAPVSDYFAATGLNTGLWNFVNPLGDASVEILNGKLLITLPPGPSHDVWTNGNDAPRIMQSCPNEDLQIEVKFNSKPTVRYQMQGLIFQQDANNYIRIDFLNVGSLKLFAASFTNGNPSTRIFQSISLNTPMYLRVLRAGNQWTVLYSQNGDTFFNGGSFEHTMQVNAVGVFAGNVGDSSDNAPVFIAQVDQFVNLLNPGNPAEDLCPNDPNKTAPGVCGCGVPDTDSDNDGTPDCQDGCPNDANKTDPGFCGCGLADIDENNDGVYDCVDNCPDDPDKSEPGVCGCGVPDVDTDNDGWYDCEDNCPNTPNADQADGDNNGVGDACETQAINGITSDEFNATALDTQLWTVVNPRNDATLNLTGGRLSILVPAGLEHDVWFGGNNAPRIMQPAPDGDFAIEAKFSSALTSAYQLQGMIVQQDANNYIRFDYFSDGYTMRVFAAAFVNGNPQTKIIQGVQTAAPMYLRVIRSGDDWQMIYSLNGANWSALPTFSHALNVSSVGVFAGNADSGGTNAPTHIGLVDYFRSLALPN